MGMTVSDFDFELPEALIAQEPPETRGGSRLLVLTRGRETEHAMFSQLPHYLRSGDLLVLNNTRVFPARLLGRRHPSGGAVECLLVRPLGSGEWDALMHPGQKLKPGAQVVFEDGEARLHGEILAQHFHGRRTIRLWTDSGANSADVIDRLGHMPLPPYIKRDDRPSDRERYQTVYARGDGSVAAPTAGLHFTPELLARLAGRGVAVHYLTLHVGPGTFRPLRAARIDEHRMEAEPIEIPEATARAVHEAKRDRRRVVAVGTTTTRALEWAAGEDGRLRRGRGDADLFIRPGHRFRVADALITNFHLPRSTLLVLVAAFAGRGLILDAYRHAVAARYRFYSYGDAMLIQ